ncbi:MAG: class II fumarate hydratase [Phycisphaeraceae bacterium]|nr:class II fumarate hydratase [Phycisphaeraceae bacterium]MCW5753087.1 class II fumarate hydratase [Phycisphaeraceae bacterium]
MSNRIEKDSMGQMEVPADVLYGASTQRAVLNFPVSGRPVPEGVIKAYARLKAAAAHVNAELGQLDRARAEAIAAACGQVLEGLSTRGGLARHFPVDIFQTGSGTSTNMNVNEVVANLVCLARGKPIGSSKDAAYLKEGGVHPNDHVNMGQSSNDTFPTAMHVAAALAIRDDLLPAVRKIASDLEGKAQAWDHIVKIGRTHLQDATPIRLGQEFSGYASQMRHAENRLHRALETLGELAIGGTAVGTGINTHKDFGRKVADLLAKETGLPFREAENHFEAQHAKDAFVEVSGLLKTIAVSLSKIANDIRWMGSGPRCGIGELRLPAVQPGSSIMPGKVNPVICESVLMVCCQVVGNDATIAAANFGGVGSILDLCVALPVMAAAMLESIHLLARACHVFTDNLLSGPIPASSPSPSGAGVPPVSTPPSHGLQPDEARCQGLIEGSLAMCTSLVPVIGYDKSAALAYQAFKEGKTIRQLALEQNLLPASELQKLLDPMSMTEAGDTAGPGGG